MSFKAIIFTRGDTTVGIEKETVEVIFENPIQEEYRETIRIELGECFCKILDEGVEIVFEDECPDCGSKNCKNNKCVEDLYKDDYV